MTRYVVVDITLTTSVAIDGAASQAEAEDIVAGCAEAGGIRLVNEHGARLEYLPMVVEIFEAESEEQWCEVDRQTAKVSRGAP